jgi:hypothetical protein
MPTTITRPTAELAAEVAELRAELAELREAMATEVRTRRLVVVDPLEPGVRTVIEPGSIHVERDRTAESSGSAIDLHACADGGEIVVHADMRPYGDARARAYLYAGDDGCDGPAAGRLLLHVGDRQKVVGLDAK